MNRALTALAAAALMFASSAAAEEEEPFKINKRDFEKTFKVIALAPPEADSYLQLNDGVKAMLEQEITERLKKRGYTVMPSSVLAGIRAEMTSQVDGAKDPKTGKEDAAKQAAVREHAFRELWFRHPINAIAIIRIRAFNVPMESDRVEWDGTTQGLAHTGKSMQYKGNVNVSSVVVGIYDSKDAPLYVSFGGLEPMMKREGEQLQPLPADQLLKDEEKVRKAAQTAVKAI
jgi:hypothetical protein